MKIAGFKKQSLIDYPGNISSVIFTQGCNFRCHYCHNPELVLPEKFTTTYDEEEVFNYIKKYKHLLDAVCITGGEPTLHHDLPVYIKKIKALGLKVKLDSNGTNPIMINDLIKENMIDAIAMDIKQQLVFESYNSIVGDVINKQTFNNILSSIKIIKESGIDHQFRTTVVKGLHTVEDVTMIIKQFDENHAIQNFNPEIVLNTKLKMQRFSENEFQQLLHIMSE